MYFTKASFWTGAIERAVKTFAQTLAASLTAGVAITEIDWHGALAIAATATLLSVLTSLADPKRADLDTELEPDAFEATWDGVQDDLEDTEEEDEEGEPAIFEESDAVAGDDSVKAELARGRHAALEGDEDASTE